MLLLGLSDERRGAGGLQGDGAGVLRDEGGQVSHAPVAPALALVAAPAALALAAPVAVTVTFAGLAREIAAAPAILQGVGLFTLFDAFLI